MSQDNNHLFPFIITLDCAFAEFWRYNLIVHGEVLASGERRNIVKHVDEVAAVGSNICEVPSTYQRAGHLVIDAGEGDSLRLYIYILPHTLPFTDSIGDAKPFELCVSISHGANVVYKHRYEINQWSGDNIEIVLQ